MAVRIVQDKEAQLQMQIVAYVSLLPDTLCFSIPNEAAGRLASSAGLSRLVKLKKMGLTAGTPDLCILGFQGKIIFLEVKTAEGKLSRAQKWWHAKADFLGFRVYVVRSLNDVIKVLKKEEIGK